jgi:hypothetical protein
MTTALPVNELPKKYGTKAMALAILLGLVFLILGNPAVCRGLVLGALFSTINFVLMAQSVRQKIRPGTNKTRLLALKNILFRYVVMSIPLVLAIKFPRFDLMATIIGLFIVQCLILIDHIYRYFRGESEGRHFQWKN